MDAGAGEIEADPLILIPGDTLLLILVFLLCIRDLCFWLYINLNLNLNLVDDNQ